MDSFAAHTPDGPQGPESAGGSLTMSSVLAVLTQIVVKLGIVPDDEPIDANLPLLEDGLGLDSIAVLELVAAIEKHYQIRLPAEDLNTLPLPETVTGPYIALLGPASRGVTGEAFNCQTGS